MINLRGNFGAFLKGIAMGAANVIPGVSGGTVAFITGIYERLINALKSFDMIALRHLRRGEFRAMSRHVDLVFLLFLGAGAVFGIVSLARLLKWAFTYHETLVWAFFFGLIAASVPAVGRMIGKWGPGVVLLLVAGAAVAVSMTFLGRAEQNDAFIYLILCGVVAICSMIIPGLSGSFVLLLMGNYELVMVDSVNALGTAPGHALRILGPVIVGAVVGIAALSRLLSWLFRNYHDLAVALITGFVAGSLAIIWPWKEAVTEQFIKADGEVKEKVTGFTNWSLPEFTEPGSWLALLLMAVGALLVWYLERSAVPASLPPVEVEGDGLPEADADQS